MEIVAINPSFIIGPHFNGGTFSSADIVKKFMMGEYPGIGRACMSFVDVRDVA